MDHRRASIPYHSLYPYTYSMVPIKRTVFLPTVTVLKNMVRLLETIEYVLFCIGLFVGT